VEQDVIEWTIFATRSANHDAETFGGAGLSDEIIKLRWAQGSV
jgi:hypothetical protein